MQVSYFKKGLREHHLIKLLLGLVSWQSFKRGGHWVCQDSNCSLCITFNGVPAARRNLWSPHHPDVLSFLNMFWTRPRRIMFSSSLPAVTLLFWCMLTGMLFFEQSNENTEIWCSCCILLLEAFLPLTFYFLICTALLVRYALCCVLIISRLLLLQISGLKTVMIL